MRTQFEVRSFIRSWDNSGYDNSGYLETLGSPWIRRSRSFMVVDFGTNRKRVCDFLILVRHSNLGPVLHRFSDIAGFCAHEWPHPHSTLIFGCSRCTRWPMLGSARAEAWSYIYIRPWNYFRSIPTYVITVPQRHRQTDRRTDRQTDRQSTYCGITALCVASRGKNYDWLTYRFFDSVSRGRTLPFCNFWAKCPVA